MSFLLHRIRPWLSLVAGVAFGLATTWATVSAASALLPNLLLTSISSGQVVSGVVTLSASADAAGLSSLKFQVSGLDIGTTITSGSCSMDWDTRTTGDGLRTVVAIGRDSAGNSVTSLPVLLTVLNTSTDVTAPSVGITSPAAGAVLGGSVTLTATASDNTGVAGVWFAIDGANMGAEDTLAPYAFSWSTTGASNGPHTVTATARDAAGNSTTSSAVEVIVSNSSADRTAPTVAVSAPSTGATLSGTVVVTASASDNVGVVSVQFTLDGASLGGAIATAPYSLSWSTTGTPNGSHTLRAIARDAGGNSTASTAVVLTVSNVIDTTAPTVALTAPADNSSVVGTITLTATASDNVGVAGVRFTVDGVTVGAEDTASPFSLTWNSAAISSGSHTVRAVARDTAGNSATSAGRTIIVSNAIDGTPPTVSITAPGNGRTVAGTVAVTASASDNVGVAGVQFVLDGSAFGIEDTDAPYSLSWPTNLILNGPHTLTAIARDVAGNTRTSSSVSVNVNNQGSGVSGDLNGDGVPDLLFESDAGQLYAWFMNGSGLIGEGGLVPGAVDPAWQIVGVDDFNNDRRSDILWQNVNTNQLYIWLMDRLTLIGDLQPQPASHGWHVVTTGDFNGDGRPDIIWKHDSGQLFVWFMNGASVIGAGPLTPQQVDASWRIAGTADIDHDGRTDLIWQNSVSGALAIWYMNGSVATQIGTPTPGAVSPSWQLRGIADYNRDGNADMIWQNTDTGQLYIWYMNGATLISAGFLTPSQVGLSWQVVGGK